MKKILPLFFIFVIIFSNISAQTSKSKININGSVFSDYFYNVDNVIDSLKDLNGFQLRRIFFTTDFIISESFEGRFRLEANQISGPSLTNGRYGVLIKDASLKWLNIFDGSDLIFGLSPTPMYEIADIWGYRVLEKSPTDFLGIIPFRDIGIDLKGKLTADGEYNYHIKLGNNSNNAPEIDKYKRYYASFNYKSPGGFQLGLYADYSSMPQKFDAVEGKNKINDQIIGSLFIAYSCMEQYSAGANAFWKINRNNVYNKSSGILQNQRGDGYSIWAWYRLSDKIKLVGRVDRFDLNEDTSNEGSVLIVSGLDYRPVNEVSIIPNFEWINYEGVNGKDLTARLTFAYQF